MKAKRVHQTAAFLAIAVALAVVHGRLVVEDPLLARDDLSLVGPLQRMPSLSLYWKSVFAMGEMPAEVLVLDFQPLRDLSLFVDVLLQRHLGVGTFHLSNVLLWLCGCLLVYRILSRLSDEYLGLGWTAVFALHPAFSNAVAWVSARKHLLAFDFIALATLLLIRQSDRPGWKDGVKGGLAYLLSILSQPITLLWPVWAAAHVCLQGTKDLARRLLVPVACGVPMVALGVVNYIGYSGAQSRGKLVGDVEGTLGVALLALGRAFANLAFPVSLATSYYPGSPLNLVGLVSLGLFGAAAVKLLGPKDATRWLLLMLIPHLLLSVKMSNIFLFDSYLLTGGLGFFAVLASASRLLSSGRSRQVLWAALVVLSVAGLFASRSIAQTWRSEAALWAHAAKVEPTPNAIAKHAYYLAQEGHTDEAFRMALRLKEWSPGHPECGLVLANAVFLDARRSPAQKLELLDANWLEDPWMHERAGLLSAQLGDFSKAASHLRQAVRNPEAFRGELAVVVAEGFFFCERSGAQDCAAALDRWKSLPERQFSTAAFESRLAALRGR